MSRRESWPGEEPDLSEAEEADEEADGPEDDGTPEAASGEVSEDTDDGAAQLRVLDHPAGDGIEVPEDVELLEGEVQGGRRGIGIVVSRANPETANELLGSALEELARIGVGREHVTVMLVPAAFELALGAMALAKTRRYTCVIALGDASDNQLVASETASGLQLAALETGIPVSFGVLVEPGDAAARGVEAVRRGLEMADLFQQLRAAAKSH